MTDPLITARSKNHAALEALKLYRKNLEDAVGRAELSRVIDYFELGQQALDAALIELEEDRCTYCGAPPEKSMPGWEPDPDFDYKYFCRQCGADISPPPPETPVSVTEPDVGF